jgi:hypothetical protein
MTPPRPALQFDGIPENLKALARWVLWRPEERDGKITKVPFTPWGKRADSMDSQTWSAFETVKQAYEKNPDVWSGVGFVLRPPFVGLDLDNCVNDGGPNQRAAKIIERLNSYSECSPSGQGVHVIAKGKIPRGRKRGDVEMYQQGRYFTMTGNRLPSSPVTVEERGEEIEQVYQELFGEEPTAPWSERVSPARLDDEKILILASQNPKFGRLMTGDIGGYPSASEADLALAAILAQYTQNGEQILRVIRRSKLWDQKWERPDYQERTLTKALASARCIPDPTTQTTAPMAYLPEITEEEIAAMPRPENPRLTIDLEEGNFIQKYMGYAAGRSDAYSEYNFAVATFLVSTAIERKIVLRIKQGTVHPNLWLFCLGDSTTSRKTTALKGACAILDMWDPQRKLPGSFSPEAMIEALSECPRAYLLKDEAGSLLASMQKKYMEETRDFFSEIYDNGNYYRKLRTGQRKERREFRIEKPYVTQLMATTPDNFREYTSEIDLTSGWLLRYLYVFPNHRKAWKAFEGADEDDFSQYIAISNAYRDLKEKLAGTDVDGLSLTLSSEGWQYFATWQRAMEEHAMTTEDRIIQAVTGRLMTSALKLAIVFCVAGEDFDPNWTREISIQHLKEATHLVDGYFLPIAKIVADVVARSEKENLQNRIIGLIKRSGGAIHRRDLLRKLHATIKDVDAAISALEEGEEIETCILKMKTRDRVCYRLIADYVTIVPKVPIVPIVTIVTEIPTDSASSENDKLFGILETIGTDVTKETNETIETLVSRETVKAVLAFEKEGKPIIPFKLGQFLGLQTVGQLVRELKALGYRETKDRSDGMLIWWSNIFPAEGGSAVSLEDL